MVKLLRTNAFRLAMLYFVLFAASVLALLVFIYLSTADFIERQTEATIDAEIAGLEEQYNPADIGGLVDIIRTRSATAHGGPTVYLITDPALHRLGGNLSGWPRDSEVIRPGWITFPLEVGTQSTRHTDTALAKVFVLRGGFRLLVGRDLRDVQAYRGRIDRTLAWSGILTLALGVAGGFIMTRNMLRRVDVVNRTSERIIHGDLSQRVPLNGSGDEFDQLAVNLNTMLDRIERLMTGMRQVTDNIAHDLRTPLARLRARLEVTLLERPDATLYGEALRETIAEADRLLGTFNALLSIAEAEAGSRREVRAAIDMGEIVRSVAELYEPVADEKGLTLTATAEDAVTVNGDRHLLSQALANLLDNALKYTPAGAVAVTARRDGDRARIEVVDCGPGIPPERREAVFDRFVRLEGSRSTPGNGLGLSLVRAVVRLHGGDVWLEDNNPGLKAVLTLPATDSRNAPAAHPAA